MTENFKDSVEDDERLAMAKRITNFINEQVQYVDNIDGIKSLLQEAYDMGDTDQHEFFDENLSRTIYLSAQSEIDVGSYCEFVRNEAKGEHEEYVGVGATLPQSIRERIKVILQAERA